MKMAFQLCVLDAYDWFMSGGAEWRQATFDSMTGRPRGVRGWRRRCGMRLRSAGCRGHDMLMKLQRVSITSGRRGTAPPTPQQKDEDLVDAASEARRPKRTNGGVDSNPDVLSTPGDGGRNETRQRKQMKRKTNKRNKRKKGKGRSDEGTRTRAEAPNRRACRIANSSYAKLQ